MNPLFNVNHAQYLSQSEFGRVTVLGETAQANAAIALSGAQTALAIVAERQDRGIEFGKHVESGLLNAACACVELARLLVAGVGTDTYPLDLEDAGPVLEQAIRICTGGEAK